MAQRRNPLKRDISAVSDSGGFSSLSRQVAHALQREIDAGTWRRVLPGERQLVDQFDVSRRTVRKALKELALEGWIKTQQGQNHAILRRRSALIGGGAGRSIGLLLDNPIEFQRPFTCHWVESLREILGRHHIRLQLFVGQRFYRQSPARAIATLVRNSPQACWVLTHSSWRTQQWFESKGCPCVVAGAVHSGLTLPSVALDYFALCHHAAMTLRQQGHRLAAFVVMASGIAGDLQSRRGFLHGMAEGSSDCRGIIAEHDGSVAGLCDCLDRLYLAPHRPTALLVANSVHYLTVMGYLARLRLRIPDDVALVARDDDSTLHRVIPEPMRYACRPEVYARGVFRAVRGVLEGKPVSSLTQRIRPRFFRGHSVARFGDQISGKPSRLL